MKGTEQFKKAIKAYLDKRASVDELFAASYAKDGKTLDECVKYIFSEVQKSGCCGFADDDVYGMAVHYYDEDNIEVGKVNGCNVVVNHHIELTKEEKEQARQKAIQAYQDEAIRRMQQRDKPKSAPKKPQVEELSLFG